MKRGRGWLKVVGMGLLTGGCYRLPELEYPGTPVASRRLAALPSQGVVWVYDLSGKKIVDEEATARAKRNVDDSINYRVRRYGGHSFSAAAVADLEHLKAFRQWSREVMLGIVKERMADAPRIHQNVGEFRFSQRLGSWRRPLDADFVLVTAIFDGHNTFGRVAGVTLVLAASPVSGGAIASFGGLAARRAITCAVHLESARIVWCNMDSELEFDLTQRLGAQQEVDKLLEPMLSEGRSVPNEPSPPPSTSARIEPAGDVAPPPPPPPPEPERRL